MIAPKDTLKECVIQLLLGLTTEGAERKQYYLEQAFRVLCDDRYVDRAKAEFEWKEGHE